MPKTDSQFHSEGLTAQQLQDLLNALDAASPAPDRQKRRSRRLPFRRLRLRVQVLDQHGKITTSFRVPTRNVSSHGLAFLHKQMLAPGQMLKIEIPVLDSEVIHVQARVARCRHLKGMLHEVGVEFVGRTDKDPRRLHSRAPGQIDPR